MKLSKLISIAAMLALPACLWAQYDIADGAWEIKFDQSTKTLTYTQNGKQLLQRAYVEVHNATDEVLLSTAYPTVSLASADVNDEFGAGKKYTYTYSGLSGKENIEHSIYIYPDRDYILVEAAIVATSGTTKSNYIAPIVTTTTNTFLPSGGMNFIYDMPHDNDNWVGYSAQPWSMGVKNTSCEVSAFYDTLSREGLIVGSIEHDNWKSGISATPNGQNRLRNLTVAAGVVSSRTNDVWDGRPSLSRHGYIAGARVRSPKYFFGYYADWRNGLEQLGEATELLCPMLPWDGGTIFAWQSWGGMAERVNYEGAINVSDFFHDQMTPAGFHNEDGVCYMVLDSFWDNFNDSQLDAFVTHCEANGQIPGIYHTPFSYWGCESDAAYYRPYDGSPYTWADISIRANGELRKIASIALDPTHPGTLEYNRQRFEKFKRHGFKYIKLDFINNGTLEADSYYDPNVTTGMQAYTYGMDKILEMADGMFVDLSIAPVFPAKGHARRISCDSWGELSNSMYTLNSIELSWWLDRVYNYNDPDHLVLSRAENDGAARIRYTCGAMTGTVLLGDNYSLAGSFLGNQAERDLALRIATNADVNAVAHLGRSFRPVEGSLTDATCNRWQYTYAVDREFMLDTDDALYYVVFNYDQSASFSKTASFERLGIDGSEVKGITELWTGTAVGFTATGFNVEVPTCDVCLYRIEKQNSGIAQVVTDETRVNVSYSFGSLLIKASEAVASLALYNMQGALCQQATFAGNSTTQTVSLRATCGAYLAQVALQSGITATQKILIP